MYFPIPRNNNVHAITTCLLKYVNFRLRDIYINVLRLNGTLSDRCVVSDWHMIVYWYRIIVWGWKLVVIYLNQLFFLKATKAAGQDRLSKFEAVRSWPQEAVRPVRPWPHHYLFKKTIIFV